VSARTIATTAAAARTRTARRPGLATVYGWELRKLRAQKRTYLGLGAAIVVPLIFVVSLLAGGGGGNGDGGLEGIPLGRYVRETGLTVPLIGLFFGGVWFFPLVASLVAGDIVAAEDGNGTLKTILTRSVERWQVFAAKVLAATTYTAVALALFTATGLIAGGLAWGFGPLTSLSGTHISSGRGLLLVVASAGTTLLPTLGVAAIALLLSTVTRSSAASVVGALLISFVMQILAVVSVLDWLRPYLLTEQFQAWQGLLREPADWAPVVRAAWVSGATAAVALAVALAHFVRRDVAGG
jgi:ABC-2 type transport system permease protein